MTSGRKKCKDVVVCKTVEYHNDCTLDEDAKPHLPVTRSEILDSVTMVRTLEDSKKIVNHLLQCHQIVAIDVKGRDLGKRNGKISLIAVGTCNGQCLLFDIHTNCQLVLKGRLKHMLECKGLIKVMHDGCLIRSALQQCYGVKIRSIFDTQVAHAVIEGHRSGKNPRCIPYETPLFISYTYGRCVLTPADHALEKMYLENCNFWDTRPLPCKQKEYAARGVLALLPEAYNNMNRRLQGPLRITFRTLCQGKSIELADCNSMSGQGSTSSLKVIV
uniref:3'-5' exonuclease domain-containing protein n=1 Tax=Strigamia maritima TaxID=126957 RepID=T1IPL7_STRMM